MLPGSCRSEPRRGRSRITPMRCKSDSSSAGEMRLPAFVPARPQIRSCGAPSRSVLNTPEKSIQVDHTTAGPDLDRRHSITSLFASERHCSLYETHGRWTPRCKWSDDLWAVTSSLNKAKDVSSWAKLVERQRRRQLQVPTHARLSPWPRRWSPSAIYAPTVPASLFTGQSALRSTPCKSSVDLLRWVTEVIWLNPEV